MNTALKNSKINITKKYDITSDFSSYSPDCAIGAIKAQSKKKIIWCHNDIELKIKYEWKYKLLWHFMKQKYEYFNTVVAVSEGAKEGFYNVTKFKDIRVIPNFIDTKEIFEKRKETIDFVENKDYYNIISVGRLCHQKNYEQSLNLMKKLKNKKIKLYIIGGGELEHKLKKIIIKKDLTNVIMLG